MRSSELVESKSRGGVERNDEEKRTRNVAEKVHTARIELPSEFTRCLIWYKTYVRV